MSTSESPSFTLALPRTSDGEEPHIDHGELLEELPFRECSSSTPKACHIKAGRLDVHIQRQFSDIDLPQCLPGTLALHFNLAHRNRSDFCDLRLRCPTRTPKIARCRRQDTAMLHCDLSVRWKVASDLRFRATILEPKTSSFCRISGDLAQSTWKSPAIAIVRFWCAKHFNTR